MARKRLNIKVVSTAISVLLGLTAYGPSVRAQGAIGVDAANKTITVGGFTPVTGPVPFYAILTHGAEAFFRYTNEHGGIDGWKVNYVTFDDGYEPARSVAVTKRLVEDTKIFALSAAVGTGTSMAVLPYAKEQGLPMVGPIGGATAFYSEPLVFALLPDYGWSAASNADYALHGLKLNKIALLWQNDEVGRSAKRGFDLYMASQNVSPVESTPLDIKATDLTPQIRRIANSGAEAVVMFGSNANLAAALKAADRQGVKVVWLAPFYTADPSTNKLAGPLLDGVYFSSWLLPVSSDEPEVKAYREAAAKYYPNDPIGVFGLNGWTNASLFSEGFKLLLKSGKPITRENLVASLDSLHDANVGGARNVTFMPSDHRGTRAEGIIQAKDGAFVLVRPFQPYPAVAFDAKTQ
jgi:branched-chain amino acid transport system substrate-binding protein